MHFFRFQMKNICIIVILKDPQNLQAAVPYGKTMNPLKTGTKFKTGT